MDAASLKKTVIAQRFITKVILLKENNIFLSLSLHLAALPGAVFKMLPSF